MGGMVAVLMAVGVTFSPGVASALTGQHFLSAAPTYRQPPGGADVAGAGSRLEAAVLLTWKPLGPVPGSRPCGASTAVSRHQAPMRCPAVTTSRAGDPARIIATAPRREIVAGAERGIPGWLPLPSPARPATGSLRRERATAGTLGRVALQNCLWDIEDADLTLQIG